MKKTHYIFIKIIVLIIPNFTIFSSTPSNAQDKMLKAIIKVLDNNQRIMEVTFLDGSFKNKVVRETTNPQQAKPLVEFFQDAESFDPCNDKVEHEELLKKFNDEKNSLLAAFRQRKQENDNYNRLSRLEKMLYCCFPKPAIDVYNSGVSKEYAAFYILRNGTFQIDQASK